MSRPVFRALGNGVPVVVRRRRDAPVTTVSVWLLAGSRHERIPGITHLAEHVLVQAPLPGRAANAVAEVEAGGGEVNAITSREHLVLYARVPTPDALGAIGVLADGITAREFDDEVVAGELRVVDEELRLAASDPSDIVHDVFFGTAFPDQPFGRPVGGTPGSLDGITAAQLADWVGGTVHAGSVGVVISGDLDAERAVALLADGPLAELRAARAGRDRRAATDRRAHTSGHEQRLDRDHPGRSRFPHGGPAGGRGRGDHGTAGRRERIAARRRDPLPARAVLRRVG